jgi:formylglycine-generating enzyme required for sulfatase activity
MSRQTTSVTLTKDFYVGIFELTQAQWKNVTGSYPAPSHGRRARHTSRGKKLVSYRTIRGSTDDSPAVNCASDRSRCHGEQFIAKLRTKTGIDSFDLPRGAQWNLANRAERPPSSLTATLPQRFGFEQVYQRVVECAGTVRVERRKILDWQHMGERRIISVRSPRTERRKQALICRTPGACTTRSATCGISVWTGMAVCERNGSRGKQTESQRTGCGGVSSQMPTVRFGHTFRHLRQFAHNLVTGFRVVMNLP